MSGVELLLSALVLSAAVVALGRPGPRSLPALLAAVAIGAIGLMIALFAPGPPAYAPAPLTLDALASAPELLWALAALGLPLVAVALKVRS